MRTTVIRFVVIAAGLTALAASTKPALGYVRARTTGGIPHAWAATCVGLTMYPSGLSALTSDQTAVAVTRAARSWSKLDPFLASCTYLDLQILLASTTSPPPPAQYDNVNNVVFRADDWPDDRAALMVTSVFSLASTGEIVDADIEVNAFDFNWVDLDTTEPARGLHDLQNSLTHEMGHLIGLDHTCSSDASQPRPNDQHGDPIPDCQGAPPEVTESTMFPSSEPGDVSKRTLTPDDQQAVCDIYPLAFDPVSCPAPGGTGRTGPQGGPSPGTSHGSGAQSSAGTGCQMADGAEFGISWIALMALAKLFFAVRRGVLRAH